MALWSCGAGACNLLSVGEVDGKAALVLRSIPCPIWALAVPSRLCQPHFSPCAQWGMVNPRPPPPLMWGLGGGRLLSSAARLVLPPPAPSPVQVRNALTIILLTPGLELMIELHQTCPAISHSPGSASPPSKKGQVTLACTRPSQPQLPGLRFSFLFFLFFFFFLLLEMYLVATCLTTPPSQASRISSLDSFISPPVCEA